MVLNGGSTPMFPSFCNSYLALKLFRKKKKVGKIYFFGWRPFSRPIEHYARY